MALYPVPWFTTGGVEGEGGAENYGELARADSFIGSSGATGIIDPGDFMVKALSTPGAAVRVHKGTGVIRSTYPGVIGQSYVVQEDSFTDVPVAATGSSGAATKYVYLLIEDTQFTGQPPASVADGPYNSYHVTTTLPQFKPYLLLAKINQPASRSDIQPSMIVDMRTIANPLKDYGFFSRPRIMADDGPQVKLTARLKNGTDMSWGELFPGGAGIPNRSDLLIPAWANYMIITATWSNVSATGGQNAHGRRWIEFGDEYRAHTWPDGKQYEFSTEQFGFDTSGAGSSYSTDWTISDKVYIPKKLRGRIVTFAFKAGLNDSASTSGITMKALGGLALRADYAQQAVDDNTI
ncbi:hypothetical protein CXR25_13840 [Brevibacterium aurantiacum]|uniref:hypothetical protein n=1 Tax=Brevibacterium aurantiacum TaxID=273384 RepID=UPI000F653B89|nr:hypothetical protein [Brevibacterium aurantiacum]AZL13777.1 hypothetical protein CXR25_13840 [Brevibacterium aurantiacum]